MCSRRPLDFCDDCGVGGGALQRRKIRREALSPAGDGPSGYLQFRYFALNWDWMSVAIFFMASLAVARLSAVTLSTPESMKCAVCGDLSHGASSLMVPA